MAATTTLMTFRVRCPPATRSVSLLGSWDNFSRPYPMERDSRVGSGEWRGCHSFKNIICDGDLERAGSSRDGGLKMGGTYWYYYQLDDDIEFHNSAETSTTACPLLPGQLVNVLHVPFYFGHPSRDRNASVGSTTSETLTMDPSQKFLNPRPAPQPKLPRLNTSPPLLQKATAFEPSPISFSPLSAASDSSGRSFSQPSSALSQRKQRLGRPFDDRSRSTSPSRSNRFLATLRQLASRSGDSEQYEEKSRVGRSTGPIADLRETSLTRTSGGRVNKSGSCSRTGSRDVSPSGLSRLPSTSTSLAPPPSSYYDSYSDLDEGLLTHSFQAHRRNHSRSREPSPLRRSLALTRDEDTMVATDMTCDFRPTVLDTLKEAPSQQNSPMWPVSARSGFESKPYQDKRLPTLPNSPSSAFGGSDDEPSAAYDFSEEGFQSHFSALTVSTSSNQSPSEHQNTWSAQGTRTENSPLSEAWRPSEGLRSPTFSDIATVLPSFANSPHRFASLPHTPTTEHVESFPDLNALPSEVSCSTINSDDSDVLGSPASTSTGLGIGSPEILNADSRRQAGCFSPSQLFQYKLPVVEEERPESKHGYMASPTESQHPTTYSPLAVRRNSITETTTNFPHSTTMQQLIDDLSYLGDMIK